MPPCSLISWCIASTPHVARLWCSSRPMPCCAEPSGAIHDPDAVLSTEAAVVACFCARTCPSPCSQAPPNPHPTARQGQEGGNLEGLEGRPEVI